MNEVIKKDGFYLSVAFASTQDDGGNQIDETALVFTEPNGRTRYWILQHDVREIYASANTLGEAKAIFIAEAEKGNECFWSDYDSLVDNPQVT